uniref:Uncharacterized protein n=1 Tax=Ixodes ricinus TaxID=34613 RepID=V5HD22_IXORI
MYPSLKGTKRCAGTDASAVLFLGVDGRGLRGLLGSHGFRVARDRRRGAQLPQSHSESPKSSKLPNWTGRVRVSTSSKFPFSPEKLTKLAGGVNCEGGVSFQLVETSGSCRKLWLAGETDNCHKSAWGDAMGVNGTRKTGRGSQSNAEVSRRLRIFARRGRRLRSADIVS